MTAATTSAGGNVRTDSVRIPSGTVTLSADLAIPDGAHGLVIFAHGSGSGRHSPRNRSVAAALQRAGFATLLLDMLTPDEERLDMVSSGYRFDIPFLSTRLSRAVEWAHLRPDVGGLPIGLFGASTGAAAALVTAARCPELITAVVSRGGRPDLAWDVLARVEAPTLLLVGGRDTPVLHLNREAARRMRCVHEVVLVPGASHLFEEAGTLDRVTALATDWFERHLPT